MPGQTICTTCPTGFICPNVNQQPQSCTLGTVPATNQLSCVSCPAGSQCPNPESISATCTNPGFYSSVAGSYLCTPCPAGDSCTTTSSLTCSGTGYTAAFGSGICSQSEAGYFAPNTFTGQQSCPVGTYQNTVGQASCNLCDAGKQCSQTNFGATPTSCPPGSFSPLGVSTCTTCISGYSCTDSTQALQVPCLDGQYQNTATGTCVNCPSGKLCNDSAALTLAQALPQGLSCPVGYYPAGPGCASLGAFQTFTDGQSAPTTCAASQYIPTPGAPCTDCPAGFGCQLSLCPSGSVNTDTCTPCPDGNPQCSSSIVQVGPRSCPIGYYNSNSTCIICPEGSYCPDSTAAIPCPAKTYSGKGFTVCPSCPAGYDCSTSKLLSGITKCAQGSYSKLGDGTCTSCNVGQSCPAPDLLNDVCPAGTFQASASIDKACSISPYNKMVATPNQSSATACPAKQYAAFGSTNCTACPQAGAAACNLDKIGVTQDCPMGTLFDSTTSQCTGPCSVGMECVNNTAKVCPLGTKYDATQARCVECDDTHICVYSTAGVDMAPGRYCYAQDPSKVNTLILFLNAERQSHYNYQWCIDCNSPVNINQLCTFATNYFTTQAGANFTCPPSRSVVHQVTISNVNYLDQRFWDLTYQPYPFCVTDIDMYWSVFTSFQLSNQCEAVLDYHDNQVVNMCKPTYPGFGSTTQVTPTDSPLFLKYSYIEQRDFGTELILTNCGQNQMQITQGAASEEQACILKQSGQCTNDNSAYCHNGQDFQCLRGFTLITGTNDQKTSNACSNICPPGQVCGPEYTGNCGEGRFCLDATESQTQYASRPGRMIPNSAIPSTSYTNEQPCTSTYCPQLSSDQISDGVSLAQNCPAGFSLDVSQYAHNLFNCHPTGQRLVQNGGTTSACIQGGYCPEASTIPINCEPGTYGANFALGSKSDCTPCPAGSLCTSGSTVGTTSCNSGYYCPTMTKNSFEYPCPGGTYSSTSQSAGSATSCSSCTAGSYCQEGTSSPTTCPINAFCPAGSTLFTDCPINQYQSSTGSQSCLSCPSNKMCPGGANPINCAAGFNGANPSNTVSGQMTCSPASAGSSTNTPGITQSTCAPGYFSFSYATQCFPCPVGSYCTGGQIFNCPQGSYCPQGSSSPGTCTPGTYCTQTSQVRVLNCPSGSYCPTSGNSAPQNTPINYYNVQGQISGTANPCGNGYLCLGNSTGPYDSPCPVNTMAAAGSTQCSACATGSFCPIGSSAQQQCPLGYYCDGTGTTPTMCPQGTFGASINLTSAAQCTQCPAGQTCSQPGLTEPDGQCDPGFFCTGGAWTPRPNSADPLQAATGGQCPVGAYCPKGSISPQSCAAGTYNSFPGMRAITDCISCTPGYYCSGSNSPAPTGPCQAGYYCPSGSTSATQIPAPIGSYAIAGSSQPIQCDAGTYSSSTALTACTSCDAGSYCPNIGMTTPTPCPAGYYCAQGSVNPAPCAIGSFNPTQGSNLATACTLCTAGSYCDAEGLTAVKGLCDAGYFCGLGSTSKTPSISLLQSGKTFLQQQYGLCPQGYYCPQGSGVPSVSNACGAGQYLDAEGKKQASDCITCKAGYYCSTTALAVPSGICLAGYFCPQGSTSATANQCQSGYYCPTGSANQIMCAAGTYQPTAGSSSCLACTAGSFCPEGSSSLTTCPAGAYCPANSAFPIYCPAGTQNLLTGQTSSSACVSCPANLFCKTAGSGSFAADNIGYGSIKDGFQNSGGAINSIPGYPAGQTYYSYCQWGYTCIAGVKTACPAGQYCENYALTSPTGSCYQGYFCLSGSKTKTPRILASDNGAACPQSSYCLAGSTGPTSCPSGTYSNGGGLFSVADCNNCPDGYICSSLGTTDSTLIPCTATTYCQAGTASAGTTCPAGSYCPTQSASPIPCPGGFLSTSTGASVCQKCPLGFYCPYQTSVGIAPPAGYIVDTIQMVGPAPCAPGTYQPIGVTTACTTCPGGNFCGSYAIQASPTTLSQCQAGYYCPSMTTDYMQNQCQPGYYCPAGSTQPIMCPPGQYCGDYLLAAPSGNCDAGYLCYQGADQSNPDDGGITGVQCPTGKYCPSGAIQGIDCPIGKYNDKLGATDISFCIDCPPNKQCLTAGLSSPIDNCPGGYYCSTVNGVTTQTPCPAGYMCPAGQSAMIRCLPGTYQPNTQSSTCIQCAKGYYCYADNGAPITSMTDCPPGFYCPVGTAHYGSYPCLVGYYSDVPNLTSKDQCKLCPESFRCNRQGMSNYNLGDNYCIDGYLCEPGAQQASNKECDQNYYCIQGIKYPCPPGTYGPSTGLASQSECIQCSAGQICLNFNSNSKSCMAGYYCPGGISSDNISGTCPTGLTCPTICPAGSYCPEGSPNPILCPPGQYQDQQGQSSCNTCPAGKYCPFSGTTTSSGMSSCIPGQYCPQGSIIPSPCGIGEHASDDGTTCLPCEPGFYCWPDYQDSAHKYVQKDVCNAGFICQMGSYTPQPYINTANIGIASNDFLKYNGPALRGYYSSDGKTNIPCPSGTYQPSLWGQSCLPCTAGSYCPYTAMQTTANTLCPAGVVCGTGLSDYSLAPNCPLGYISTAGQPNCMLCVDGTYTDGSTTQCKSCPSGSFCNSYSIYPQNCTGIGLCKGGASTDPPCNDGSYYINNQCVSCPLGQYCVGGVQAGLCVAGYYCNGGKSIPFPDTMCNAGYYCPLGTTFMVNCPTGYFRSTRGGIQATDCTACEAGQICRANQDPYDCPMGYYCPVKATIPLPCPIGTYNDQTKSVAMNDCKDCPSGYYCSKQANSDYKLYPCPAGKYCTNKARYATNCPPGTYRALPGGASEADCINCPPGFYCPLGTINPIQCTGATNCPENSPYFQTCEGGFYCNVQNNYQAQICPENFYCPRGTQNPIACIGRQICPEQSEIPELCDAGNYVVQNEYGLLNSCEACPPGTYSTVLDTQCQTCNQGYVCYGSTNRRQPTVYALHNGEICPKGYYCPAGSSIATPCPVGTYNPLTGAVSVEQCLLCPANTFNDIVGQSGCRPCGAYAQSSEGSSTCQCLGNFRTFSRADSSCRCKSGYDFVNEITQTSQGEQSGTENCSPLVFDRCDGFNQTRNPVGTCVDLNDCTKACNGGNGTRSQTLGICSCKNSPNVDIVCSQSCRNAAPSVGVVSGTVVKMSVTNATTGKTQTTTIDLSKVGDAYGGLSCSSGNCQVRTTEMSPSGGFYGRYGAPSLVQNAAQRLRMRFLESGITSDHLTLTTDDRFYEGHEERFLATTDVDYTQNSLRNPVICVNQGDSMVFTIRDPTHYPVYLKDSVMNSNPSFDYGAFLILADQMKNKAANNNTKPSLFSYTFSMSGSYVFVDSSDTEQIMIVRVTGVGEVCPDPDRYIQPLSGDSAASSGVSQNSNIIIRPDVPLISGMGSILIFSVLTVMVGVGYCLHKGWSLPKVSLKGYRNLYAKADVDHTCEETFRQQNDFSLFKSGIISPKSSHKSETESLIDSEDDLDDINLNIHLDVLNAGKAYLDVFGEKKYKRAGEKLKRKQELMKMITEIEQLVNIIGHDAMVNQMQIFKEDNEAAQDEAIIGVNEKAEEEKREKMIEGWSDRDKGILEEQKNAAREKLEAVKKELNKNVLNVNEQPSAVTGDVLAMAMYDAGDVKSRQNQIVRQIEADKDLTEAEKEVMLRNHYQNLNGIDEMMEAERKKQDQELEKAIKERVERRKKALESKYKKEINLEIKEGEAMIKKDIDSRKDESSKQIDKQIEEKMEEAASKGDKGAYRRSVDELKKERQERKAQAEAALDKEQESRCLSLKEQVMKKWTAGAVNTENDLEAILTGQQPDVGEALAQLKGQRDREEEELQRRLAERKKRLKNQLKEEKDRFEQENSQRDPIVEEEIEKKRINIMIGQALQASIEEQHLSINPIGQQQLSLIDSSDPQAAAKQDQANFQKLLTNIDTAAQASQLLEHLKDAAGDNGDLIQKLMREDEEAQKQKLEARRELLRQRKALKKQQELEQLKLNEQLEIMQMEDEEKAKIGKNYLKEVFQKTKLEEVSNTAIASPVIQDKSRQQELLVVFNEFASDAMLQRLSNLLMKQFVEREAALKLLVQKYMDARLIEKTHIKRQFKAENEKLAQLVQEGAIGQDALKEAQKSLRLSEENMLREVDLQFDRAHKEEEARIRAELDKRHSDDQIALRKLELEEQLKLKRELELTTGAAAQQAAKDEEIERMALRAFEEAKRREQERKARNIAMQKQEMMREIDKELKNKYTDYEELLKRKRDEENQLQDQTMSIRKKLNERRKQIKEAASHFSEEDLKNLRERAFLQMQTLDSVYEEERRRQQYLMSKRLQQKKSKMEKQAQMKQKVETQEVDKIKSTLLLKEDEDKSVDVLLIEFDEDNDTHLVKRLREWMRNRQQLKIIEEQQQLADTVVDLDSMTLKKLIMKLDNLEKLLRELRKLSQPILVKIPQMQLEEQMKLKSIQNLQSKQQKVSTPEQPQKVKSTPPQPIIVPPPANFGSVKHVEEKKLSPKVIIEQNKPKELPISAKFVNTKPIVPPPPKQKANLKKGTSGADNVLKGHSDGDQSLRGTSGIDNKLKSDNAGKGTLIGDHTIKDASALDNQLKRGASDGNNNIIVGNFVGDRNLQGTLGSGTESEQDQYLSGTLTGNQDADHHLRGTIGPSSGGDRIIQVPIEEENKLSKTLDLNAASKFKSETGEQSSIIKDYSHAGDQQPLFHKRNSLDGTGNTVKSPRNVEPEFKVVTVGGVMGKEDYTKFKKFVKKKR